MEVSVVELKPTLVFGMTKAGPYKIIAEMIPVLREFTEGKTEIIGAPIFVCHESAEEAMEAGRNGSAEVEAAVPIAEKIEETSEMKNYTLPGGRFAKIAHKGRYEDCGLAYQKLFRWIAENKKQVIGPTREHYLNDPHEVKPEEILTEIFAPIE